MAFWEEICLPRAEVGPLERAPLERGRRWTGLGWLGWLAFVGILREVWRKGSAILPLGTDVVEARRLLGFFRRRTRSWRWRCVFDNVYLS